MDSAVWRRLSPGTLALWILGPFIMALLCLMIVLWLNLQAVRSGIPPRSQSFIVVLFSLAYIASSLWAGRWARPEGAAALMTVSTLLMALVATASFLAQRFEVLLALGFLSGAAAGQYFVPFQIRIGHAKPFRALPWNIACYNISWGAGDFLGPVLIGALRGFSEFWLIAIVWALAAAHAAQIRVAERAPSKNHDKGPVTLVFSSTKRMRIIGWTAALVGLALYSGLAATLYPGLGVVRGWTDRQIAAGVAALALPIPLSSALWARLSAHLERPWLLIAATLLAGLSVAAIPHTTSWPPTLLCMAGVGLSYSAICFHSIYYVNADPEDAAMSVGINEAIFGLGAVLGPMSMGLLAWDDPAAAMPYRVGACVMAGAAALMAAAHLLSPPCVQSGRSAR